MHAERLVSVIRRKRRKRVRGVHGARRSPVVVAHPRRGIDFDVRDLSGTHDPERDDAARAFGRLRLEPVRADEREELLHVVREGEVGVERGDGRPEGDTRARGAAVRRLPRRSGRSREGPPTGFATPGAAFGFSGLTGFFGSGIAFAEGRTFSEGFSITGFAFGAGAGSAGAATGAGAGGACGRPREAGLTTRTGRDMGTKTGALRGLPMKRRSARNPACAENRDG